MRALAAAAVVVVALAVVFTVQQFRTARMPETVATMPSPPAMHVRDHVCLGQDWAPRVRRGITVGRVTVDAHPDGGTVFWLPGLNAQSCRAEVTDLTAAQADSVAKAVRSTKTPGGSYACPADDAAAAWVFFRYADRRDLEVLKAELTGCQFDSAPHRGSIGPAWQVAAALQRFEPHT